MVHPICDHLCVGGGEAAMFNLVLSVRQYYSSRYSTFVKFIFLMKLFSL
jgi:hypothetical protein